MSFTRPAAPPARATVREWTGLAVIALPCMLYSMDLTVLNLAIPSISEDLKPTASQLLWIVDIYGFFVAGLLVTMGTLGDRIGRRRLLLIGAFAFGVASVLAAFSTSANMLIATRALLGVAGATLAPSTLSLIRNMFLDPAQRTLAIGVWISSYSAGAVIGPVLGGVLLQFFAWGSVFLIGVPVMVLLLVLGPILLPEYRDPDAGRLDLASVALSLGAVLAAIYGIKQIAEHGPDVVPMLSIAVGAALGWVFAHRQRRLANPMIDLRLFRLPAFTVSLAAYMLACFVMFGMFLYNAQYLQLVLGLSPLHAGLWSVPGAAGFIVGSMVVSVLVRWMRPAFVMGGGLAVAAVGFGMLVVLPPRRTAWHGWWPARSSRRSASRRCSRWPPTWWSAARRRSGPAWPRPSRRPVPNSAARWASRSWAASARPSTAARWPMPCRPAWPARPRSKRRAARSAGRWRWPGSWRAARAPNCSTRPARPCCTACASRPGSVRRCCCSWAAWWPSGCTAPARRGRPKPRVPPHCRSADEDPYCGFHDAMTTGAFHEQRTAQEAA
jgi:MFS family permease